MDSAGEGARSSVEFSVVDTVERKGQSEVNTGRRRVSSGTALYINVDDINEAVVAVALC